MKPYFKLKFPFSVDEMLAPSFKLPRTEYDVDNPYIPVEKDSVGNRLNCATHNKWIHRFNGPAPGSSLVPVLDILHPTFVNFFKERDIDLGCIFIFYACPGSLPGGIHSDWGATTHGRQANFAINWTIGEPGKHNMVWYEPKRKELKDGWWPIDAVKASLAYPIPTFHSRDVNEIARCCIDEPTLVRTDIPHNAENHSQEPRWCFSVRTNQQFRFWEDCVELFKDLIIEDHTEQLTT
jgi:hypothetical protein